MLSSYTLLQWRKLAKAYFYAMTYVGFFEYDEKVRKDLMDHKSKTAFALGIYASQKRGELVYPKKKPSRQEIEKSIKELGEAVNEFRRVRESLSICRP